MRKYIIILSLACFFSACTENGPKEAKTRQATLPDNIQAVECSSYLQWLLADTETILSYSFYNHSTMEKPIIGTASRYTDYNTIMLTEDVGIRIHDTYTIDRNHKSAKFYVKREAEVISKKTPALRKPQYDEGAGADAEAVDEGSSPLITVNFEYTLDSPLNPDFIRPRSTRCDPIPLCYREDMEIEWQSEPTNNTGVIVVAEWNGLQLDGTHTDTTIVHSIEIADDGTHVLPNNIFEGMPNEAFVNLWLIRGKIVTIQVDHVDYTFEDLRNFAHNDPETLLRFLTDNPEIIMEEQILSLTSAAISVQPMYLIGEE